MKKIDLLYQNLVSLLKNLYLESVSFESYYSILDDEKKKSVVNIAESISSEQREVSRAYFQKEFYPSFTNLRSFLKDFEVSFSDFPSFRKNELYAIISIIQKLTAEYSGSENVNLEEEIDTNLFEIIELNESINKDNFFYFDSSNITSSLFLFNINKIEDFEYFIESISEGSFVLFYLLGKLGVPGSILSEKKYVLVDTNYAQNPKIVFSTLCLHIIKSGGIIHNSFEYNFPPRISPSTTIQLGKNYQQFADSIDIISEYNYQKDILDKYLRIYHVFENFMYKSPLVNLERESTGQVFSIRDFKRMYDKINKSEISMLKKLFDNILSLPYSSTHTFNSKILDDWQSLIPNKFPNEDKINGLLKILCIQTNNGANLMFDDVNASYLSKFISQLVYSYRNSMVHNRETEFHLTHLTLINHSVVGDTAKIILEEFLLPNLEELIFNLIICENSIVWYTNSTLRLWHEN